MSLSRNPAANDLEQNTLITRTKASDQSPRRRRILAAATIIATVGLTSSARSFSRAARLIAQEPGAQSNSVARATLPALATGIKRDIVVENHGGAGGRIAARVVATALPDGQTVGIGGTNNLVLAGLLGRDIGYDPARDFTFLCAVARLPFAIAVRASLPIRSVEDFVRYARANPGILTFGSAGVGGSSHLAVEAVAHHFQLDLLNIPFRGSSLATNEVVAERVDLVATDLNRNLPLAKSGKLRLLAATGSTRSRNAPSLATLHEQGLTGFYLDPRYGLYAPKGIDTSVAARWQAAAREAYNDPDTQSRSQASGVELVPPVADTLQKWIERDRARYQLMVKRLNLASVQ